MASEKIHSVIWVCMCCMLSHANGECCVDDSHGGDGIAPWSSIQPPYTATMGTLDEEHTEECEECDHETDTYSSSPCEGCGSYLHGERHAFTLWSPAV